MSNNSGKIERPIRTAGDVAAVLNVNSPSVGYLCSNNHGKINKWSKYKPVRHTSVTALGDSQFRLVNFGFDIKRHTQSDAYNNYPRTWEYLPPNRSTDPKRIGDFTNYIHSSLTPLIFGFAFEDKAYYWNSILGNPVDLAVKVSFRRNGTGAMGSYSQGIGAVGIALSDLPGDVTTDESLLNYVPCVTARKDSTLYVANATDTFGGKFGTGVDNLAIVLSNFSILKNAFVSDANGTGYPADATDKQKLELYPRINVFTPSVKGGVFTNLSTTTGGNGHFSGATNPFIGVPDGSPLTIYKYKRIPLLADYGYINVPFLDNFSNPQTGGYVDQNASDSQRGNSWGGKIIPFQSLAVTVTMVVGLENLENMPFTFVGDGVTDSAGIFNKACSIKFRDYGSNDDWSDSYSIGAGAKKSVQVRISYNQGVAQNFTMPSASPYAQCRPWLKLRVKFSTGTTGEAFEPKVSTTKVVRWH